MSELGEHQHKYLRRVGFKRYRVMGKPGTVAYGLGNALLIKRDGGWEAVARTQLRLETIAGPVFSDTTTAILYCKVEGWTEEGKWL